MTDTKHNKDIIVSALVCYERRVAEIRTNIVQGADIEKLSEATKTILVSSLGVKSLIGNNGDFVVVQKCMDEIGKLIAE